MTKYGGMPVSGFIGARIKMLTEKEYNIRSSPTAHPCYEPHPKGEKIKCWWMR